MKKTIRRAACLMLALAALSATSYAMPQDPRKPTCFPNPKTPVNSPSYKPVVNIPLS